MSKLLDSARRARELIAAGWTQGRYANDETSQPVNLYSQQAVCFCLLGGIQRGARDACDPNEARTLTKDALLTCDALTRRVAAVLQTEDLVSWNDARNRTQVEVLAVLDDVIASIPE